MFYLDNIPPGLAGSQKFDNVFSIDANGILTVTTIHVQTGNQHSLTLDPRTSGRMSTEEVNEVIDKAKRMRETDEMETKRVVARTELETFCQEIKFGLLRKIETDSFSYDLEVVDRAQECLDWVKINREASEATYRVRLRQIERVSGMSGKNSRNDFGAKNQSFESYLKKGEKSPLSSAIGWFFKAYRLVGGNQKEKKVQAALKFSQSYREYAEEQIRNSVGSSSLKRKNISINQAASVLVFELKIRALSASGQELVAELQKIKDFFFEKVSDLNIMHKI